MHIDVNLNSDSSYSLFNISKERAGLILDLLSSVCDRAFQNFEIDYHISSIGDDGQISYQLAIGKIITEMVSIAETENEKHYVLYCAHTGISRVSKMLRKELEDYEDKENL